MDESNLERLVPAGEVLDRLARAYDQAGQYTDWNARQLAATEAILARLVHGQVTAWASACSIDSDDPRSGPGSLIFDPMDFLLQQEPSAIPQQFWCNFSNASPMNRTFDLLTGDCSFSFVDDEYRYRTGNAFGVHFDRRGLPPAAVPYWKPDGAISPAICEKSPERNKGGAPRKYDWERVCAAIIFQWADEGSWQPRTQAEVRGRLANWFSDRNQYPADSSLKERARWLFEEFRLRNGEDNNRTA